MEVGKLMKSKSRLSLAMAGGDQSSGGFLDESMRLKAQHCVHADYMCKHGDVTRRDMLQTILRKRTADAKGCASLPVTIAFFTLYALAMGLHEDITNVHFLESALRSHLRKGLDKVESVDDVWVWLKGPFAQEFFVQRDMYGDALPRKEWSRVAAYSQVQSSVLLKQSRETSHAFGVALKSPSNYTANLQSAQEGFLPKKHRRRRLREIRKELLGSLPKHSGKHHTFDFALYPTMTDSEIRTRLNYLEDRRWLDQDTSTLVIEALLLNAELGRARLEQVEISLFFPRGGGVFYELSLKALFLEAHDSAASILADFLFIVMLIGNTFVLFLFTDSGPEVIDPHAARQSFRSSRKTTSLTSALGSIRLRLQCKIRPRDCLETMIILCGWFMVIGFCFLNYGWLAGVRSKLEDTRAAAAGLNPDSQTMATAGEALHSAVHEQMEFAGWYTLAVAWYNLLLLLRFFLAFKAHARLAIVINTLMAVGVDLFHFMVVFTPTFLAYMVSGNMLFGRRIEDFATLQASFGTCFRIVIENEFEWEDLSEEHFWTTALWVWSFMLLIVLIMLNMVLAIILDVYNEVRTSMDLGDSIFAFLVQGVRRIYYLRRWLNDEALHGPLSEMDGSNVITKDQLMEICPELTRTQADLLFHVSTSAMNFKMHREMDRSTVLKICSKVKAKGDRLNNGIYKAVVRKERKTQMEQLKMQRSLSMSAETLPFPDDTEAEPMAPTLAKRLMGNNRPFPGMPQSPGGEFPPLLAPSHASNEIPDSGQQPDWLTDLHKSMDDHDEWMSTLQNQLEELQWQWHSKQKLGIEALLRSVTKEQDAREGGDSTGLPQGPVRTKGGVVIL